MFLLPPTSDQISYCINQHLACLWLATLPDHNAPCLIGTAVDVKRSITVLARRHRQMEKAGLRAAWWSERPRLLLDQLERELGSAYCFGLCERDLQTVSRIVELCARRLELRMAPHELVMASVTRATTTIKARVETARQSGGLSFISRKFKRRRAAALRWANPSHAGMSSRSASAAS
jgi:hypothetical protein